MLDIQPQALSHDENTEEDSAPVTTNSEEYSLLPQDSDRLKSQSQSVQNHAEHSLHQDAEQSREQYQNNHRSQLEDIPELEDEDEDWEDGQFMDVDLIDHHNTTTESDQIHQEYSTHFAKSTDQEYNSQNNTTPGL